MKKNNKIIGSYPVVPNKFKYFDKEIFFGLVVDTVIAKEYQGNLDNLVSLNNSVYEKLKEDDIYFVYGIANKKYYKIIKALLEYSDICHLNYYVKVIKINKKNVFNIIVNTFIYLYSFPIL